MSCYDEEDCVSPSLARRIIIVRSARRTRAQALAIQGERSSLSRVAAAVLDGGPKGWKCIFRFWAGTQATVIRLGVGSGLHFAVLESIKPLMLRDQVARGGESHRLAGFHAVVAGALSRGITTTVMTPVTVSIAEK